MFGKSSPSKNRTFWFFDCLGFLLIENKNTKTDDDDLSNTALRLFILVLEFYKYIQNLYIN